MSHTEAHCVLASSLSELQFINICWLMSYSETSHLFLKKSVNHCLKSSSRGSRVSFIPSRTSNTFDLC